MKSRGLETFLFGVTFGIGMTLLSLYIQKPDRLAAMLERIAETGRARKGKEGETKKCQKNVNINGDG